MEKPIRVVELFAGVGGFRLGLEQASSRFQTVWANQWEPAMKKQFAYECYVKHFGAKKEYVCADIKNAKSQIPSHDLLVGGFPCQSFSIAGVRKGFDDTRGTLFFEIARIASVKKPKYLFLENVPGLLNHDSGKTFETILRTGSPKSCKLFGERRHSIADELLTACGRNE